MDKVVERFLKYVSYNTRADENIETCPSTEGQLEFARYLVEELNTIGMKDVSVDTNGYVMATLPSNVDKDIPTVGFIAHMDTSPDMSGENIKPQLIENYGGGDIVLNRDMNILLSPKDFPELKEYKGETLITTDGTTLLGADDKAGIAEIITAMEYLVEHREIAHGIIKLAFTPDEEIGRGADLFDVEKFGASFAYTLDGGSIGELEYENFNAAVAKITVNGRNVHPGSAKNKMKNAVLIGMELASMFPEKETPGHTEGYEGFYHLNNFEGDVEEVKLTYIIREFAKEKFQDRKIFVNNCVNKINEKYGNGTIVLELKDQYYNMKEKIDESRYIVEIAHKAMKEAGVEPDVKPIRGGTDGARLSFMGLPTPNIFAGGHNFHGKYEFIPVFAMKKAVDVIVKIVELMGKK